MNFKLGLVLFIFFGAFRAQARVFDINKESFAAYVTGAYSAGFENTLSSQSNSTASVPVSINSQMPYNLSGEFGFVYSHPMVNLKFGLEFDRAELKDQSATDASATSLYTLSTKIYVYIPKAEIEFTLKRWGNSRFFLGAGAGWANLAARNSYTMTTAGTSAYSSAGVGDFYEDLRATAPMYEGTLGYEGLLSDLTTYAFLVGYRSLKFDNITHNWSVTTFQGPVNKSDPALNIDGSARSVNLSNYFFGMSFRFWIH